MWTSRTALLSRQTASIVTGLNFRAAGTSRYISRLSLRTVNCSSARGYSGISIRVPRYKQRTWGKGHNSGHLKFYPGSIQGINELVYSIVVLSIYFQYYLT